MTKWYGLNAAGDMVYVGEFEDFDAADDAAPDIVWLVDESTARDWLVQLKELLT